MLVETAWKSCSGARAIISTLKMKPAAAAPSMPRVISGPALRKACSLNMITNTAAANPPPSFIVKSDESAVSSASLPGAASWGSGRRSCAFFARRSKANGTTIRLRGGRGDDPDRDPDWPLSRLTATSTANRVRKHGLGEDQRREQAEAAVAGEEAAGEVAGGVEEDRAEEDPVEGFVACEQAVLERPAQDQGDDREERAPARSGSSRRPASAGRSVRLSSSRSEMWRREQLFDRPVEGRDGDEDGRPEDRDLAVVVLGEDVRGDQEVGVGDQAGEADADRQEARGLAVVGGVRLAAAASPAVHRRSRGRCPAPPRS